jgi:dihydrofolate synthase/folylpolyglutamate synthase
MNMNYSDTINYLYGLQKYGIKLGLVNILKLLSILGNPHHSFPSIHIAGTNGKGSTSAMTASILSSAGFNVGLFTSPHLLNFGERIKVNNNEISEADIISITDEIRQSIVNLKRLSLTFFEFITAMCFLYFMRKKVDIAVIETGMGGRLDSTNVILPLVTVITNISCDHQRFLGNTIEQIAEEKAGIIKESVPVVCAQQEKSVLNILEKKSQDKRSQMFLYDRDFKAAQLHEDIGKNVFNYEGELKIDNLELSLLGKHQIINAALALKTSELVTKISSEYKKRITPDAIQSGLRKVNLHGRLEIISHNPDILIDGAHNPAAAFTLAESLKNIFLKKYNRLILIAGIMSDKDITGILKHLLPLSAEIIFTAPDYERAAEPGILADCAKSLGYNSIKSESVSEAVLTAKKLYKNNDLILITGSFYTISEAMEVLGQKGTLTALRETL